MAEARAHSASMIPVGNGRDPANLVLFVTLQDGSFELVCISPTSQGRHYVRKRDGTCAAQRAVLERLADPDWISQTVVRHPGREKQP